MKIFSSEYGNPLISWLPVWVVWIIARILFLPTLIFRIIQHYLSPQAHPWWRRVDEFVIVGAHPLPWDLSSLYNEQGVRAFVNVCEESKGLVSAYQALGIDQLQIPTIDYLPPSYEDIVKALRFIGDRTSKKETVYIHCKAGKGRSATVALCWLLKKYNLTPSEALERLLKAMPIISTRIVELEVVQRIYKATKVE